MEYKDRKMLRSEPQVEPTAITLKMIADVLAEQGKSHLLAPAKKKKAEPQAEQAPAEAVEPTPAPRETSALKRPPTAEEMAKVKPRASFPDLVNAEDLTIGPRASGSLISRLLGRG